MMAVEAVGLLVHRRLHPRPRCRRSALRGCL